MGRRLSLLAALATLAAGAALIALIAIGAARAPAEPPGPRELLLLVGGSPAAGGCAGAGILRIDYRRPALALAIIATAAPGADGDGLCRLADRRGPDAVMEAVRTAGRGRPAAWLWLDGEGLWTLASGLLSDANKVISSSAVQAAARQLAPPTGAAPSLSEQVDLWRRLLLAAWRPQLRVVSFENYVLAGGHAWSDLDLRGAAAVGGALRAAAAADVSVGGGGSQSFRGAAAPRGRRGDGCNRAPRVRGAERQAGQEQNDDAAGARKGPRPRRGSF